MNLYIYIYIYKIYNRKGLSHEYAYFFHFGKKKHIKKTVL